MTKYNIQSGRSLKHAKMFDIMLHKGEEGMRCIIELHPEHGVNPRMTYCPQCGGLLGNPSTLLCGKCRRTE